MYIRSNALSGETISLAFPCGIALKFMIICFIKWKSFHYQSYQLEPKTLLFLVQKSINKTFKAVNVIWNCWTSKEKQQKKSRDIACHKKMTENKSVQIAASKKSIIRQLFFSLAYLNLNNKSAIVYVRGSFTFT